MVCSLSKIGIICLSLWRAKVADRSSVLAGTAGQATSLARQRRKQMSRLLAKVNKPKPLYFFKPQHSGSRHQIVTHIAAFKTERLYSLVSLKA